MRHVPPVVVSPGMIAPGLAELDVLAAVTDNNSRSTDKRRVIGKKMGLTVEA